MNIVTSTKLLRIPSEDCISIQEGGEISRKLHNTLSKLNKKVNKKQFGKVAGVGLSANQIGIYKRVCIIKPRSFLTVLINPIIVDHSTEKFSFDEGCLSLPGETFKTHRYVWITVESLNLGTYTFGPRTPNEWTQENILNSVISQHEIAHGYGLLPEDFEEKEYPEPEDWLKWSKMILENQFRKQTEKLI